MILSSMSYLTQYFRIKKPEHIMYFMWHTTASDSVKKWGCKYEVPLDFDPMKYFPVNEAEFQIVNGEQQRF